MHPESLSIAHKFIEKFLLCLEEDVFALYAMFLLQYPQGLSNKILPSELQISIG